MTTDIKAAVEQAMTALVDTGDVDTLAPLLHDDFVHHRPDSTSSTKTEWLSAVRAGFAPDGPLAEMRAEITHVLADGDHVVMSSRRWLPGGGREIAVVDILRFADGLAAEAWEIIEPVHEAAAHLTWWE